MNRKNTMKIKVYHQTDVPSTTRNYWFTIHTDEVIEDVAEAKEIEVSDEEFYRLIQVSMEEVREFVILILKT